MLLSFNASSEGLPEDEVKQMQELYKTVPMNAFRFLGNQIICKTDRPDDNYSCFRIGGIKIGDKFEPKTKPWKVIPQPNDITASVFSIVENDEHYAYWVIGHREGVIVSLQLTGDFPDDRLAFATIKLSDSESKVADILGPRYKVSKVEEINGTIWDYAPFPITMEFKNGLVYSMRITE